MQDPKNQQLKKALLTVRAVLQEIPDEEIAFSLYHLHRKQFESGDKEGKVLALQLK